MTATVNLQRVVAAALMLALTLTIGAAQAADEAGQSRDDAPPVFLYCDDCDFSYIRVEIPFVNWVRNREDAVVHILITDQRTGSGGREYTFDFIGLKGYLGTDQNLSYVTPPGYTDDEERQGLTGILKIGLLP